MPIRLDRRLDPQKHEAPERSFWEMLPRRNFRRVLFLVAVLLAVLALRRAGGGAFRGLLDAMAPPPPTTTAGTSAAAPGGAAGAGGFQHLRVTPAAPGPASGSTHP